MKDADNSELDMPLPPPLILVTRPHAASQRFAVALGEQRQTRVLIAPVIETEPLGAPIATAGYSGVIFTSAQAVLSADGTPGQTAYCVGAATADQARAAGFTPRSGAGNADDLVDLILQDRADGTLLYLRGEETAGSIAERLRNAGRNVDEHVVYRQVDRTFPPEVLAEILSAKRVIAPVFSPRSARRLAQELPTGVALTLVAISPAAAEVWPNQQDQIIVADAPTLGAMVDAVVVALDSDSQCSA